MDNRPRYGSFNRPIPIHLGDVYLVGAGTMTEAATRLAERLEKRANSFLVEEKQILAEIPDASVVGPYRKEEAALDLEIVAALRAIPQEPVAWQFRYKNSKWLNTHIGCVPDHKLKDVEYRPLYAAPIKPGPSEPIAQGQREAIALALINETRTFHGLTVIDWNFPALSTENKTRALRQADAILATLPQPPVGACRGALRALKPFADAFTAATEKGFRYNNEAVGYMGEKVSFQDFARAFDTLAALAPSAQEGETLETLIREYARDLRRNSSGGDDYPWEWAKATADYLEVLIERASPHSRPERGT